MDFIIFIQRRTPRPVAITEGPASCCCRCRFAFAQKTSVGPKPSDALFIYVKANRQLQLRQGEIDQEAN
ncbi:hypothetical protein ACIQ57_13115 [Lysinibacillus xylanilyticus]|uniref:hypothetical protein n=1 Tax=Lysinibacillus xylanilyticus TaxID=582475 RepID=UPI00380E6174